MSSLLITTSKYPYFEDVTPINSSARSSSQFSQVKCSSDNLRTIYNLMVNIRTENEEGIIIEKLKENKVLSSRHFKIITHEGDLKPIITTFCHMAVKKNAKKVLDWLISEFQDLSNFENYRCNLDSPLNYVIENLPDNESNSYIVSKLAKGYYDIQKKCVNRKFNFLDLTNKQIDILKKHPNIFATDRIACNQIIKSAGFSNAFFRALINGKHLMYETMLGTYVEKEGVKAIIAGCSSMPWDLVSIVYDYALFVITPKVQDILSLTFERVTNDGGLVQFFNPLTFVMIHLQVSNDLDRKIQLIKTAKFLLNYNENLAELPVQVASVNSDPLIVHNVSFSGPPNATFLLFKDYFNWTPNLIDRIKNGDAKTLATEIMNWFSAASRAHSRLTYNGLIMPTDK